MHLINGWRKKRIGCSICKTHSEDGVPVRWQEGPYFYCDTCAEKKRKEDRKHAEMSSDDEDREWWNNTYAKHYV